MKYTTYSKGKLRDKIFPKRSHENESTRLGINAGQKDQIWIAYCKQNIGLRIQLLDVHPKEKNFTGDIRVRFKLLNLGVVDGHRNLINKYFKTGNAVNLSTLRKELMRDEEKSVMTFLSKCFIPETELTYIEARRLEETFPDYPIAYFSTIPNITSSDSTKSTTSPESRESSKRLIPSASTHGITSKDSVHNHNPLNIKTEMTHSELSEELIAEFTEGEDIRSFRKAKTRNSKVVRLIKKLALVETGHLRCACCKFDMNTAFGFDYIEAAHRIPISRRTEGYILDPNVDLYLLCPNCHVAYDRLPKVNSIEALRAAIKVKFQWIEQE